MTNEEAIAYGEDYLKDLITACCHIEEKHKEFVRMAIEALKDNQWQKGYDTATANANETKRSLVEMYEKQIEALKAQPCEDAVSRTWIREHLGMFLRGCRAERTYEEIAEDVEAYIDYAPPVTPKPIECEDAVSREAVIEVLDWHEHEKSEIESYIREMAEDIKALPSVQPESRWISVSGKLPPEGTVVLVCGEKGGINISHYGAHRRWGKGEWHYYRGWGDSVSPVAWMPLPEPYKEGESE